MENISISKKIKYLTIYISANNPPHKISDSKNKKGNKHQLLNRELKRRIFDKLKICQGGDNKLKISYQQLENLLEQNALRNVYSPLIEKLINHIMISGKKSTALNILYTALQLLVCKSEIYKKPASEETHYTSSGIRFQLNRKIKTPFSSIFCFTMTNRRFGLLRATPPNRRFGLQIRDLLAAGQIVDLLVARSDEVTRKNILKLQKAIFSSSSIRAQSSLSKTELREETELLHSNININEHCKRFILNRYKNNIFLNKKPEKYINEIYKWSFPHEKASCNTNVYGNGTSYKKDMIANLLQPKKIKGFFTAKAIYKFISKKNWEKSVADKPSIYHPKKKIKEKYLRELPNNNKIKPDQLIIGTGLNWNKHSSITSQPFVRSKNSIETISEIPPKSKSKTSSNYTFCSEMTGVSKRSRSDNWYPISAKSLICQQGEEGRGVTIEEEKLLFSNRVETDISDIFQKMSIDLIQKAIENVKPWIEVRKVKKRGIVYLVPSFVQPHRQETLAIRWILEAARKRKKNRSSFLRGGINKHGFYNPVLGQSNTDRASWYPIPTKSSIKYPFNQSEIEPACNKKDLLEACNKEYDLIASKNKQTQFTIALKPLNSNHKTNQILQKKQNQIPKLLNMGYNQQRANDSHTKLCSFFESLAAELFDASKKQGKARQKRDEMHKVSLASRVNLRFRWWKR